MFLSTFKILTKWHFFVRISNGPSSGFQFTSNIWSIYKPTSFWPNFGESGSRLEVCPQGKYLCVLNEIGKHKAWIVNVDYGCVNSNTWLLFNVVFNLEYRPIKKLFLNNDTRSSYSPKFVFDPLKSRYVQISHPNCIQSSNPMIMVTECLVFGGWGVEKVPFCVTSWMNRCMSGTQTFMWRRP